jgi:hypothetical protein
MESEEESTANLLLSLTGSELLITKTVKEIMSGYSDPILFMVKLNSKISKCYDYLALI